MNFCGCISGKDRNYSNPCIHCFSARECQTNFYSSMCNRTNSPRQPEPKKVWRIRCQSEFQTGRVYQCSCILSYRVLRQVAELRGWTPAQPRRSCLTASACGFAHWSGSPTRSGWSGRASAKQATRRAFRAGRTGDSRGAGRRSPHWSGRAGRRKPRRTDLTGCARRAHRASGACEADAGRAGRAGLSLRAARAGGSSRALWSRCAARACGSSLSRWSGRASRALRHRRADNLSARSLQELRIRYRARLKRRAAAFDDVVVFVPLGGTLSGESTVRWRFMRETHAIAQRMPDAPACKTIPLEAVVTSPAYMTCMVPEPLARIEPSMTQ